jgi:hypothetical protein
MDRKVSLGLWKCVLTRSYPFVRVRTRSADDCDRGRRPSPVSKRGQGIWQHSPAASHLDRDAIPMSKSKGNGRQVAVASCQLTVASRGLFLAGTFSSYYCSCILH